MLVYAQANIDVRLSFIYASWMRRIRERFKVSLGVS